MYMGGRPALGRGLAVAAEDPVIRGCDEPAGPPFTAVSWLRESHWKVTPGVVGSLVRLLAASEVAIVPFHLAI